MPVQTLLAGGIATLPLALLSDTTGIETAAIVETIYRRAVAEATTKDETELLLSAAYILAGLRFSDTIVQSLFKGVLDMEESSTYQAILKRGITRGRIDEARRMLIIAGNGRLGTPSAKAREMLEAIASVERLEQLISRVFVVETWDDLLAS